MWRKRGVGIGYFEVCNGVRQREERLTEVIEGEVGEGCGKFYIKGVSTSEVNGGDSGGKFGDLVAVIAFKSQARD